MSELTPETPGPEGTELLSGSEGEVTDTGNGHPAWQPILDALPDEALRSMVTPHLQEWDRGVQERFQSLHSELEPWKPVIENADPQLVTQALSLVQQLEENPQFVYEQLQQAYGFGQGTPAPETPGNEPQTVEIDGQEYDANDPILRRLGDLEGVLGGISQFIQSQQQADEEASAIEAYEAHMAELLEDPRFKGGPYNEDVVDAMVANGVEPAVALAQYQQAVREAAKGIVSPATTAPAVMSGTAGGSGLPSQQQNPALLNSADTKALVAEMARRAAEG